MAYAIRLSKSLQQVDWCPKMSTTVPKGLHLHTVGGLLTKQTVHVDTKPPWPAVLGVLWHSLQSLREFVEVSLEHIDAVVIALSG